MYYILYVLCILYYLSIYYSIEVLPRNVDVNVHPTKHEVMSSYHLIM